MKHAAKLLWLGVLALQIAACTTGRGGDNLGRGPVPNGAFDELGAPNAPDGAIVAVPMPSKPLDMSKTMTRIVFASCAQQRNDQSIWDIIAGEGADLMLYMGDNVYGDVRSGDPSLPELKAAYMRLAQSGPFERARKAAPLLTVWDDHDYGLNDGGEEFALKDESEALFNYVWAVPEDAPRRSHPGVYDSWIIGGEDGKRVQIIILDTRYFRSPLKRTDEPNARGKERFLPDPDPAKTMLGDAQWTWLGEELKKPADLRLLVSSIQVLSEGHGWEAWRTMPLERQKLYDVIAASGAKNLMVLSGDRHSGALYERDDVIGYPLFEATSSSLNIPSRGFLRPGEDVYMEPDPNRLTDMIIDANYGLIEIDWDKGEVAVSIRGEDGAPIVARAIDLSVLQ